MFLRLFICSISTLLFCSENASAFALELTPHQQNVLSFNAEQNVLVAQALRTYWVQNGGLELIVAGSSSENIEGQFGHLALRFVGSGGSDLTDIVIEAMGVPAEKDGPLSIQYRGVVGKYPILFLFTDIKQQIKDYYKNEVRGYHRLPLPSNAAQRKALLENVIKMSQDQFRDKRYRFFSFNCASYLLELLELSGFHQVDPVFPMRPTQVFNHFRKSFLVPWPENKGVDVSALHDVSLQMQSSYLRKKVDLKSYDTLTLQRVIVFTQHSLETALKQDLKNEIKERKDRHESSVVYDIVRYPEAFYDLDLAHPEDISSFLLTHFSKKTLKDLSIYNRASLTTLYPGQMEKRCRKIAEHCEYFESASILIQKTLVNENTN